MTRVEICFKNIIKFNWSTFCSSIRS